MVGGLLRAALPALPLAAAPRLAGGRDRLRRRGGLPAWFIYQERTIFFFYAVVFVPFLCLAVTQCLGLVIGGPGASPQRRQWGAAAAGAYLLLAVANFLWLLPVLSAEVIPYADWARRMWWRSWI